MGTITEDKSTIPNHDDMHNIEETECVPDPYFEMIQSDGGLYIHCACFSC